MQKYEGFEREMTLIIGECPFDIDESYINEVFLEQLKFKFESELNETKSSEDVLLRKNKDGISLK